MRTPIIICAVLAAATLFVYAPVRNHAFINLDDNEEIYDNLHITQPTFADVGRAFTTTEHANWIPVTRLSWMAAWQVLGNHPGLHHLADAAIHTANGLILFLVLRWMTGSAPTQGGAGPRAGQAQRLTSEGTVASAFVAALFLLHPLHVESVAWAVERKDTLSGLFWMLTLAAYTWYARRPSAGRYVLVVVSLALGLMAKPMLVTLPLVLLLLDWWPLGRFAGGPRLIGLDASSGSNRRGQGRPADRSPRGKAAGRATACPTFPAGRLLLEKAPLLVLVLASSIMTYLAQAGVGAVNQLSNLPAGQRVANAVVSYVLYLYKMIVPKDMAIFYPYNPALLSDWLVVSGAAAVLIAITVVAIVRARRTPYLAVGWFWYLGTLVPVIGLVQVGGQSIADRYTYLPLIGIFIIAAWGAVDIAGRLRAPRWVPAAAGTVVVAACAIITSMQIPYWVDNVTVFTHAITVNPKDNDLANLNLGNALHDLKKDDDAAKCFERVIGIRPNYAPAYQNLALILAARNKPDQTEKAIELYRTAVRLKPDYVEAWSNLGVALYYSGKVDDAIEAFQKAISINANYADARGNLGAMFSAKGEVDKAIDELHTAILLNPKQPDYHEHLAKALLLRGRLGEAIDEYRRVGELRPTEPAMLIRVASALATAPDAAVRNGTEAIQWAEKARRLAARGTPAALDALDVLAAAYAEAGRFQEAVATAKEAIELASEQKNEPAVAILQGRLALYESGRAYHVEAARP